MANWQGLLGGLQRGANTVSGLLYPGFDASGVDPRAAQAARSQAMMQLGAGLLGGANFGQAYGAGQQSGFEPIEQARREAVLRSDAQWRQMQTDEIQRRRAAEDAAAAEKARLKALGAGLTLDPSNPQKYLDELAARYATESPSMAIEALQTRGTFQQKRKDLTEG